jgi:hypothetical protein
MGIMTQSIVLPVVTQLNIAGVYDAGIPNSERVLLRALTYVNLGEYYLLTGRPTTPGFAFPLTTDVLWLGPTAVTAGSWIVVYTGPGQDLFSTHQGQPVIIRHWDKRLTIFHDQQVVPILIHIDAIQIGPRISETTTRQLTS